MYYIKCIYCNEIVEVPAELVEDSSVGPDGFLQVDDYCCDACKKIFDADDGPNDFFTWDYDR